MHRTGQYAIVEHTILIGIGIAIAIGFLATFQTLSGDIEGSATEIESQLLAMFIAANGIDLVESGADGRFTLTLPDDITDNVYAVQMTDNGVEVITTGRTTTASLYGVENRIDMNGHITSRTPEASLIYAGNQLSVVNDQ